MARKRVPELKDVPTIGEAGYPQLASEDWAGLLVKAGTPASVIGRLNEAVNKALTTDKVREALAKTGTDVGGASRKPSGCWCKTRSVAGPR